MPPRKLFLGNLLLILVLGLTGFRWPAAAPRGASRHAKAWKHRAHHRTQLAKSKTQRPAEKPAAPQSRTVNRRGYQGEFPS